MPIFRLSNGWKQNGVGRWQMRNPARLNVPSWPPHMTVTGHTIAPWTAATVRAELPIVTVVDSTGRIETAHIGGRLNQFAGVMLNNGGTVECAWETIAHCLNADTPIRL
jgi:hypothetical protein